MFLAVIGVGIVPDITKYPHADLVKCLEGHLSEELPVSELVKLDDTEFTLIFEMVWEQTKAKSLTIPRCVVEYFDSIFRDWSPLKTMKYHLSGSSNKAYKVLKNDPGSLLKGFYLMVIFVGLREVSIPSLLTSKHN